MANMRVYGTCCARVLRAKFVTVHWPLQAVSCFAALPHCPQALGVALKLTFQGQNQLGYIHFYVFIAVSWCSTSSPPVPFRDLQTWHMCCCCSIIFTSVGL